MKCDFLLLTLAKSKKVSYFIELKGKNLIHAIDQINASISELGENLLQYSINARIVLSKVNVPDIMNSHLDRLKKI